ncbi:MAG: hypothetical protein M0Q93_10845, partial [Terrimicrobiaceae bacterium]|nr:hypothetical protein [Terrimicrobiaceae bacterium]
SENILEALGRQPLNCVTVVFEKGYVDQDYQDELAAFYSKSFKDYPHRCTRLHFFAADIPVGTTTGFGQFRDQYLGFMVLRPTDLQRVGRTCIKPIINNGDTEFITCTAEFSSHILGERFSVSAMPFIQQDTQVGACAQACLWMLARYMSHRFGHREFLPAEVNLLAKAHGSLGRHYPAERGLTFVQMLDALQGMTLSALSYQRDMLDGSHKHVEKAYPVTADPAAQKSAYWEQLRRQRTAKLADIAYRYIESGLPVIFGTSDHALVGIGHKYDPNAQASISLQRIPGFFVNNDNTGPYVEMPLFGPVPDVLTFDQIQLILVVIPPEATLSGEEAERMAVNDVELMLAKKPDPSKPEIVKDILSAFRPDLAPLLLTLEYRSYLRRSVEFQQDIRAEVAAGGLQVDVGEKLLLLDYPKYIWVTEFSSSTLLNQPQKTARKCLGRVIVDSTAPAPTRGVIANHFADLLILNDRQGKEPTQFSIHPNSTPFQHKFMTK